MITLKAVLWDLDDTLYSRRDAAEYFHIGEKKMRQIVEDNLNADFLLESGNRVMIKRRLFEEYPERATVI